MTKKLIIIEGTYKTPAVSFDPSDGRMDIKGRSITENVEAFYSLLSDLLTKHTPDILVSLQIYIKLEFINMDSVRYLFKFFKNLEQINNRGKNIIIYWYYDEYDDDMFETGKHYQTLVNIPFMIRKHG